MMTWPRLSARHRSACRFCSALSLPLWLLLVLTTVGSARAGEGAYYEVKYPAGTADGELTIGVTYTLWLPEQCVGPLRTEAQKTGVPPVGEQHPHRLRGIIVHQHGCGTGACQGGETAAYDWHWQALAREWNCALLGPSYHQSETQNCRLWCDPRNGSRARFLQGLHDLASQSGHPELEQVPWCLWGHSGGAFWASLMQASDPERIVAIWLRSGSAYSAWEKGEIPKPEFSPAMFDIPTMCNPGLKERDDPRFSGAWTAPMAMFREYRPKGALIGFAPDPATAHECGDSRSLAIPYFDACLRLRLQDPASTETKLKKIDPQSGFLATLNGDKAEPAAKYTGDRNEAGWLPDAAVAGFWAEYVKTGSVTDVSPPAPPVGVVANLRNDGTVELTWPIRADLESGVGGFVIVRDGTELMTLTRSMGNRPGRVVLQGRSYHDTPEKPLTELRYVDRMAKGPTKYELRTVNGQGLRSEAAVADWKNSATK